MKKNKKIKLSTFTIAKLNNSALKGGVASNACNTDVNVACLEVFTYDPDGCKGTIPTRPSDSLNH